MKDLISKMKTTDLEAELVKRMAEKEKKDRVKNEAQQALFEQKEQKRMAEEAAKEKARMAKEMAKFLEKRLYRISIPCSVNVFAKNEQEARATAACWIYEMDNGVDYAGYGDNIRKAIKSEKSIVSRVEKPEMAGKAEVIFDGYDADFLECELGIMPWFKADEFLKKLKTLASKNRSKK